MSVLQAVESWAESQPDKLLFSFLDSAGAEIERHSYASFIARVDVIASHLVAIAKLEPNSRVLLAFPPGLEMICALFACARAGMIGVPVAEPTSHNVKTALLRIAHVANDCGAQVLLTSRDRRDLIRARSAIAEPSLARALAGVVLLATEDMVEADGPTPRCKPGEIFFLQYTSGSTNQPKGVIVGHKNLMANCAAVVDHDNPVGVSWLPQHHDMGLMGYYIYPAMRGGHTFGFSPASFIRNPKLWLESISRYKATASSAPNFAFDYCMMEGRIPEETRASLDLSSLRILMVAAEPVRPAIYRRFIRTFQRHGLKPESFFAAYGLAENTVAVSSYGRKMLSVSRQELAQNRVRITRQVSGIDSSVQLMSCGVPLADNEVRIVDPETRLPLRDGQVGEIWVSGASKCRGYWGKADLSRDVFEATLASDPPTDRAFLRTQDMGFVHDGELYVCGRIKDMIIVRGQNIYPQDIEAAVEAASPAVRKGGVTAFAVGEEYDGYIAVVAEIAAGSDLPDPAAIGSAVRDALAIDVSRIVLVPPKSIPKTSSGKIIRSRTRELLSLGGLKILDELQRREEGTPDSGQGPAGAPFSILRTRYRLSGNEPMTLMDAGVDSFDLVVVMHELQEMLGERGERLFGKHIDARLLQHITIAELFRLKDEFDSAPDELLVQLSHVLARTRAASIAEEEALMRKDSVLPFTPARPAPSNIEAPKSIFLTGGTGFLGPFILASLLAQTAAKIKVLVRASTKSAAQERLLAQLRQSGLASPDQIATFHNRVEALPGALEEPHFGLSPEAWQSLTDETDAIYHNGALVNYLFTYQRMRDANVKGTAEILRLAFEGRPKPLNHVSTTFIYGWAKKDVLRESDSNDEMQLLDFGYSQSKWASEQMVLDAQRRGLPVRIFRPSLITPSLNGDGASFDITLRLMAFIIKYGIGVNSLNQISFTPVDIVANNIVAISQSPGTLGGAFNVTRDEYAKMADIVDIIARRTGAQFQMFGLKEFVPEVIRRCTKDDLLFPLLDFLIDSIDKISSMQFKRYDNSAYQAARNASPHGLPDPSLEDTVGSLVTFLERNRAI